MDNFNTKKISARNSKAFKFLIHNFNAKTNWQICFHTVMHSSYARFPEVLQWRKLFFLSTMCTHCYILQLMLTTLGPLTTSVPSHLKTSCSKSREWCNLLTSNTSVSTPAGKMGLLSLLLFDSIFFYWGYKRVRCTAVHYGKWSGGSTLKMAQVEWWGKMFLKILSNLDFLVISKMYKLSHCVLQVLSCYWPQSNAGTLTKKCTLPDKDPWTIYPVRIFSETGKLFT